MNEGGPASHDSLPLAALQRIDRICQRFEDVWKEGRRPKIESCLNNLAEPERTALLRELLALDLAYRRRHGHRPTPAQYEQRFPEHVDLIRAVFADISARAPRARPPVPLRPPRKATVEPPTINDPQVISPSPERSEGKNPGATEIEDGLPRFRNCGHFRIMEAFAEGGMGKISIARDLALQRDVALKELHDNVADGHGIRQRFVTEAEITGQLEHPGVVPIHALGIDDRGQPFYVMRLIEGQTLKTAIEHYHKACRPTQLRELLRRFVMVCHTMAYAHDRGVIHRDLKPANIMLGQFGETVVLDWGLAKPFKNGQSEESTAGPVAQQQLAAHAGVTASGAVVGTPAYMPPEQAAGKGAALLGPASDVYSLGAILYKLLTGKSPYTGGSTNEVLEKVKTAAPPKPCSVHRNVPRALEGICLKAMARQPEDRYRTATALAEEVQHWLDDEPVTAYTEHVAERIYRWSRKHKAAVVSGAIGLFLLILVCSAAAVALVKEQAKVQSAQRLADDYLQQATEAERRASDKEAEADQLAKEVKTARDEGLDAVRKAAQATGVAGQAKQEIALLEKSLAAKTGENQQLKQKIEATRAELAAAETRATTETKRADAAAERAESIEKQVIALRREAGQYRALATKMTQLAAALVNPQQPLEVLATAETQRQAQSVLCTFRASARPTRPGRKLRSRAWTNSCTSWNRPYRTRKTCAALNGITCGGSGS